MLNALTSPTPTNTMKWIVMGTHCPSCGHEHGREGAPVETGADACPKCGGVLPKTERVKNVGATPTEAGIPPQIQYKNEGTALVLAALLGLIGLGGIGHIYVGKIPRGAGVLAITLVTGTLAAFLWLLVVPVIIHIGFVVWSVYDARGLCRGHNAVLAGTGRPPW